MTVPVLDETRKNIKYLMDYVDDNRHKNTPKTLKMVYTIEGGYTNSKNNG